MNERADTSPRQGFWTYTRLALAALAFFLIVIAVSTGLRAPQAPATAKDSLPPSVLGTELRALDGPAFRLSDYKDRVVVLDIWATWCGPCRLEIPHLVRLSEEYGPRGVEVIGLSVEDPASAGGAVRDFAREFGINYRLGWAEQRWTNTLTRGAATIPQTFVIGRGGRRLLHLQGYTPQISATLREAIDRALAE
ncbi:MAG TPA: TlpA disulfide reductase family protein [Pyrinomonadaceae bacterium]